MKTRELFEQARNRQNRFSLRFRLTLMVAGELIVTYFLALLLDALLKRVVPGGIHIPLGLELMGFALLIGTFVTAFMSKLFFDPIKKLRKAMGQVADGDFTVWLEENSNSKEIQEINTGFNLMTHELRSTEILQTDFVSNVSHEFKTPINAIEGYSMLLQDCENLTREQREYVDKIVFNTRRLSTLTGSILLLSKLENQSIPTNQSAFSLDEQIRQSIVAMEDLWVRKDIQLDVEMEDVSYFGNELLMRHVWDNLLGNAIKFSPEGGTVWIRLNKQHDQVVFSVEDQGPGLTEEAHKHIFDKFYQADGSHKQEGNGLGLALVDKILKLEQGTIRAENRPEGGCCFTVTLKNKT